MNRFFLCLASIPIFLSVLAFPVAAASGDDASAQADETTAAQPSSASTLSPEFLYTFLLAEIAGARGELEIALNAYVHLARQTADPRIAKRATEFALSNRNLRAAAETARIWIDSDPNSEEARQILSDIEENGEEYINDIQIQLARILANNPGQLEQNLLGINHALSGLPSKQAARNVIVRLTQPYLASAAAHLALAEAAMLANDESAALASADHALELRPDWDIAHIFKSQLLIMLDLPDESLLVLTNYLTTHPDSQNARHAYARTLAKQEQLSAAREQFQWLLDRNPENAELMNTLALIAAQENDLDSAEPLFRRSLQAGFVDPDSIHYNLGLIAEKRKHSDEAIFWYRKVNTGEQFPPARTHAALLLAQKNQFDEAITLLHDTARQIGHIKMLLLLEANILRTAKRFDQAQKLLNAALEQTPEDADFLYEIAMLYEQTGQFDAMEARLRQLIALQPEHAHAHNALGYFLTERGVRLQEAEQLIVRALALEPNNPFILDSMGWLFFRQGEISQAVTILQHAYTAQPDPEIAAHLGEALWALQRHDEARHLIKEALITHPDHAALRELSKRLFTP